MTDATEQNPVGAAQRGGPGSVRWALYAALVFLYLLHNDLWLWHDGGLVLGLPSGLAYHLGYCLATAALMAMLVRWAWPVDLEVSGEAGRDVPRRRATDP